MKLGKHLTIPEGPEDIERLWETAQPLDAASTPEWLSEEELSEYRFLGSVGWSGLSQAEQQQYFAELEQFAACGLIIDEQPNAAGTHFFYMSPPPREAIWSIGIYRGDDPFRLAPLHPDKPALSAADVTDVPATFVADPFMVQAGGTWHMFFEVMNWRTHRGEIGLATSPDALEWTYCQIVLTEPFHLSYPYVFEWNNEFYMIPETHRAGAVRLYKAKNFPSNWVFVRVLLRGPYLADASVFRHDGGWWMFVEASPNDEHDLLRLYYADRLRGPWTEHPESPLIKRNPRIARPAGRVIRRGDQLIRFAQNCEPDYGTDVRGFEIRELTRTAFHEEEFECNPVLGPTGTGWNLRGMHHIDAHQLPNGTWIACVDGWTDVPFGSVPFIAQS